MNWYQLKAWWRYRRAAKGRHGTHSPFVYQFVEQVLRHPRPRSWTPLPYTTQSGGWAMWLTYELMLRVRHYLDFRRIVLLFADHIGVDERKVLLKDDMMEFKPMELPQYADRFNTLYHFNTYGGHPVKPGDWIAQFNAIRNSLEELDVVAFHDLYATPAHTRAWQMLRDVPEVTMSIDLFHTGLLFFSKDFKERQHFVLKAPAR